MLLEYLRTLGTEDIGKCLDLHCVVVSIGGGDGSAR